MKKVFNFQFSIFNYKISANDLLKHPLFSGSFVMVFGSNLANFFAYIYHVILGRMFGPEAYGELAATLSLIGMISSAVIFFSVVVVKFVSSSKEKEQEKFFSWFLSRGLLVGAVILLISFILTPAISSFMHIDRRIIILVGPVLLISIISLVFKAFLQGILRFKENVIVNNVEMAGRLLFALVFIYFGMQVFGAILGLLVSGMVGLVLGRYYLKEYRYTGFKQYGLETKKVLSYSLPILVSSVAINSILSADVILAKHFFDPTNAGIYASVATIGRIIFFGTAPIALVMFPLISKKQANGEKYVKIFLLSLLMTAAIGGGVLLLFLVLPQLAVRSLYGDRFLAASGNIFLYGIFMLLFSLGNVILNYYLSVGRTKLTILALIAAVFQITGIYMYHDSLASVITVCIVTGVFLFTSLLLYFLYETRQVRA